MNTIEIGFISGTRLLIQLKGGELYEGCFSDGDKDRITIYNISKYPNAAEDNNMSTYNFYKTEIQSIVAFQKKGEEKLQTVLATVPLLFEQLEELKEVARNYVYIPVTDNSFHAAINDIKSCEMLSVIGLGSRAGRSETVVLISVATKTKVYIFDNILSNKKPFQMGLKDVLESENIMKVIHNSSTFCDCLHHVYQIQVKNIFDVQIADMYLRKENDKLPSEFHTLNQIIHAYIGLPLDLTEEFDTEKYPRSTLLDRPVSNELMLNLSLQSMYLLSLKAILDRRMFHEIYTVSDMCLAMCLSDEHKDLVHSDELPKCMLELLGSK